MSDPSARLQPYESILEFRRAEFKTLDGTVLRGNFYHGRSSTNPAPTVIFCHGIGLVKEIYLENWYRHFVAAGYHVLSYDHRSFGHSEGQPRENFDWLRQAEDLIDAVTFVRALPEVDAAKVFAWGVAHAGGMIAIAAALDKRIAGILMFLPCIDGAWDKSRWGDEIYEIARRNRFQETSLDPTIVNFWPLGGTEGSVLSGDYVQAWSECGRTMAQQGGNTFTGRLTVSSFWSDFNTRPLDYFDRITPTPMLWIMASDDVVCGPLSWTKSEFDKLKGPKDICILEGEHLPQYFDTGFTKSVQSMLDFMKTHTNYGII